MMRSFSGTHPFRPQCLRTAMQGIVMEFDEEDVAFFVGLIDGGECPRCLAPLPTESGHLPAGSRATACRCIPICAQCGLDEALSGPGVEFWPFDETERINMRERGEKVAVEKGWVMEDKLVTDKGVSDLKMRPNPGGWAEFGYDD